jgi:hypothetical protein
MSLKGNIKVLGLALAAVFAFSALSAVAAQANAPRWTVAGATIGSAVTKEFHAESTGQVSLIQGGTGLEIRSGGTAKGECTAKGKIVGSGAGEPGKNKEVTLTCKNAKVFVSGVDQSAVCTVHSPTKADGTIETNELESTLVWLEGPASNEPTAPFAAKDGKVGDLFQPEANTATGAFVRIEITGASCPVLQNVNVTGGAIGTVENVTQDLTEQSLNFPATAHTKYWTNQTPTRTEDTTGLKVGGAASIFVATFDVVLNPCELFGVEPG